MSSSAPTIIPSPPARTPEEMTLEALLAGVQLANLANPAKVPEGVYKPRERGPGTEERPISTQMMRFRISSRAIDGQWYQFLTTVGWHGLWVPKELTPPDMLLDSYFTNHAMVFKPEELYSEYRVRTKAKEIVLEKEGLHGTYIEEKIKMRWFTIESPVQKAVYRFGTQADWKGLKAPRRVVPNMNKGDTTHRYLDVYLPHELEGKTKIRKAALELVKNYEAVMTSTRKDRPGTKNFTVALGGEHLVRWNVIRAFLAYVDLPETQSAVARWLLEKVAPLVPKQEDWESIRKEVHAEQKKERRRNV